jgi:5-methylcytosine-specific restriction endonuclease McrA
MFIDNKYTKIYNNIIAIAKLRNLSGNVYKEKHHIVPKSLGGSNSDDNLVYLTAREHFVCHRLLTKMTNGIEKAKMVNAVWAMSNLRTNHQNRYLVSSRVYQFLREEFSRQHAQWRVGQQHSEDTKKKISIGNKGKQKFTLLGKPRSEQVKEKISNSLKGVQKSESHKQKIKEAHVGFSGKITTLEHRKKISEKKLLTPKKECLYCGKQVDPGNFKKSHGPRCKHYLVYDDENISAKAV